MMARKVLQYRKIPLLSPPGFKPPWILAQPFSNEYIIPDISLPEYKPIYRKSVFLLLFFLNIKVFNWKLQI